MKNILFFAITIMFTSACAQKSDCNDYHDGVYKIVSNDNKTHLIIRKDDKQVEDVQEDNYLAEFDIEWIDDCTYLLTNKNVIHKPKDYIEHGPSVFKVTITDISENYLTLRCFTKESEEPVDVLVEVLSTEIDY